jgi:hypothetical protein
MHDGDDETNNGTRRCFSPGRSLAQLNAFSSRIWPRAAARFRDSRSKPVAKLADIPRCAV